MWIIKQRSSARSRPSAQVETLESRLLLATTSAGSQSVGLPGQSGSSSTPATTRIDTYNLPAGAGYPAILVQVQWNAADPTQGTLIVAGLASSGQYQWTFNSQSVLQEWASFPIEAQDGSNLFAELAITLSVDPATSPGADPGAGTYDLSVSWSAPSTGMNLFPVAAVSGQGVTPTGTGMTGPSGLAVGLSGSANSTAAAATGTATATGGSGGATGTAGSSTSSPIAPPSLDVQGRPLPLPGGSTLPPWTSLQTPGVSSLPLVSDSAGIPPTTPIVVPPVGVAPPPSTGGPSSGLVGPFLPSGSPAGALGGGGLASPSRGDARSSGPGAFGDGPGPLLIVGPLPLGRSEPDGGIFARSFTSTLGPAGPVGVEAFVAVAMPSGVGQSSADAPRWSGSLAYSAPDNWRTPDGVDQGPSGQPSTPPPSPLAASAAGEARNAGIVLLPSVAVASDEPADTSSTVEPALGTFSPALALAVRPDSSDARPAGPALPPPPSGPTSREGSDRSRDWRWGWPAVTIMALVGSAVMIFRLHATQRATADRD